MVAFEISTCSCGRLDLHVLFRQIKCTGTSVLGYSSVLRLPRWCRQNGHVTCSRTRCRSTVYTELIGSDNYSYWKISLLVKVILFLEANTLYSFFLAIGLCYFFKIQTAIARFTPEYSKVASFACFRWLFWCTPSTLKLSNQVRP